MNGRKHIHPALLRQAQTMVDAKVPWIEIGRRLQVNSATLRARLDPEFAERRKGYSNASRRMRRHWDSGGSAGQTTGDRPPPEVLEERDRRLSQPLTTHQLLLGDPLPGRSALDQIRATS